MKTTPLIPRMLPGAINKPDPKYPKDYRMVECEFMDISHIFKKFHYKKDHMGGGISYCLSLLDVTGTVVAGAVLGKPRHLNKYKNMVEIRRMARLDECPKNTESYFLGKIVWFIKNNTDYKTILSYADTSVGHKGTIYSAANFKMIGQTSGSVHVFWKGKRYHPRSLTIERPYAHLMRRAVETGEAKITKGSPKNIWIYEIIRKHKLLTSMNICDIIE